MGFPHFILDLAALALWLNWLPHSDNLSRRTPATLYGTLRPAEPVRRSRWVLPAALAALLVLRVPVYQLLGKAANWNPRLDMFFIVPSFPLESFYAMLVFSVLSFVRVLAVFYFWLLFLNLISPPVAEPNPFEKMIQLQLGPVARWPRWMRLVLPFVAVTVLWAACHPALVHAGVVGRTHSAVRLIEQGLLLGAALWLSLKYLICAFLLAHLLVSYVYLGTHPVWDFINGTARNLLARLDFIPLRIGRIDFAPVVGIIIALLVLHVLPNAFLAPPDWLIGLLGRHKDLHNRWVLWPQ